MTTINFYGILNFEFGESLCMNIRKAKEVIEAITVNKINFRKKLIELANEGLHYTLIVDGKYIKNLKELEINKPPKQIDFVPAIMGSGFILGGLALIGVSMIPAIANIAILSTLLMSAGTFLISYGIQQMLTPDSETITPEASVGTASSINQSFIFSNRVNVGQQGSPVPIGYGRLRIGSTVIQSCIKSYPTDMRSKTAKSANNTVSNDLYNKEPDNPNVINIDTRM
jgi:predicted phage tail protein